jgi:hypothetical protein
MTAASSYYTYRVESLMDLNWVGAARRTESIGFSTLNFLRRYASLGTVVPLVALAGTRRVRLSEFSAPVAWLAEVLSAFDTVIPRFTPVVCNTQRRNMVRTV